MSELTEVPPMVEQWADACEADGSSSVDLTSRVSDALRVRRSIADLISAVSRSLAASGAVYDLPGAKVVERALIRWMAVARALSTAVDRSESAGKTVAGASDLREAIRYDAHSLSVTPEQVNEQLTRIAREGHQRGVTTEVLRRELLQGRMGRGRNTAAGTTR